MKQSPVSLPGIRAPSSGFEAPFEMLAACHERVVRMLTLMSKLQAYLLKVGLDTSAKDAARDVMRYFDIAAPLHHQDEERHVFPALRSAKNSEIDSIVEQLLSDHKQMELCWASARCVLLSVVNASSQTWSPLTPEQTLSLNEFAKLYDRHIEDEERLIYPAAQEKLSIKELQAMSQDMMARRGVSISV